MSKKCRILDSFCSFQQKLVFLSTYFKDNNFKYLLGADKLHDFVIKNTEESTMNYIFLDKIQNVYEFEKCIDSLFLRDYFDSIYNTVLM